MSRKKSEEKGYKGFKVQLDPNNWQEHRLVEYSGAARFAYNWALEKEMTSLAEGNGIIPDKDLRKEFTQLKKEKDYLWLKGVYNEVTKQAIKDCVEAFWDYMEKRKSPGYVRYTKRQIEHAVRVKKELTEYDSQGHPKFKCRWKSEDRGFYLDPGAIKIGERKLRVPTLYPIVGHSNERFEKKSTIRLKERNRIPLGEKYSNPRVVYDGEHWWLTISVEMEPVQRENSNQSYEIVKEGEGLDVGIKATIMKSNGESYININKTTKVRKLEKAKKRLQRQVARKYRMNNKEGEYKKTENIKKLEKRILRKTHRVSGIRENFRHQMTSGIVNSEPGFVSMETLNVKGMMKNKHLSKAIQDQGFYEIRRQLTYKCKNKGIPLILADPWFPSSKTCNCCGYVKKDLKLSDRVFKCPNCGNEDDRDWNAAKNLKWYGEQVLQGAL